MSNFLYSTTISGHSFKNAGFRSIRRVGTLLEVNLKIIIFFFLSIQLANLADGITMAFCLKKLVTVATFIFSITFRRGIDFGEKIGRLDSAIKNASCYQGMPDVSACFSWRSSSVSHLIMIKLLLQRLKNVFNRLSTLVSFYSGSYVHPQRITDAYHCSLSYIRSISPTPMFTIHNQSLINE